jgi:hypothetical protein
MRIQRHLACARSKIAESTPGWSTVQSERAAISGTCTNIFFPNLSYAWTRCIIFKLSKAAPDTFLHVLELPLYSSSTPDEAVVIWVSEQMFLKLCPNVSLG